MKTSIATVSLCGSLIEKLHACAAAGFDGVEIFEPDLIASDHSPEEIRALSRRLGLSLDLYQPLRDIEGVDEDHLRRQPAPRRRHLRHRAAPRYRHRPGVQQRRDRDRRLRRACRPISCAASATSPPGYDIRIAFEALAWGRFVDDYRRAWRIVELADHPNVGVCLDSFHVLSRGHDPRAIEDIPADKIFYLQLADAPALTMDVLSWSRHHRLFPGEGAFDLPTFVSHVLAAGYDGPLSLEVFNDTFRQTDPDRTAVHALRSLRVAAGQNRCARARGMAARPCHPHRGQAAFRIRLRRAQGRGHQRGRGAAGPARLHPARAAPHQAGLAVVGRRGPCRAQRTAGARSGPARRGGRAAGARRGRHLAARGRTDGAGGLSPDLRRRTGFRARPSHPTAPRCTGRPPTSTWVDEFENGLDTAPTQVRGIDHVNLAQPWQTFDDAVLFFTSVFGLTADTPAEVPGPNGLVRSQVDAQPPTTRCGWC